jgi:hypothetical protein
MASLPAISEDPHAVAVFVAGAVSFTTTAPAGGDGFELPAAKLLGMQRLESPPGRRFFSRKAAPGLQPFGFHGGIALLVCGVRRQRLYVSRFEIDDFDALLGLQSKKSWIAYGPLTMSPPGREYRRVLLVETCDGGRVALLEGRLLDDPWAPIEQGGR